MSLYVQCQIIQTTVPTVEAAQAFAKEMIARRLAACVHIEEIQSVYRWNDVIENSHEYRLSIKTTEARSSELMEWIRSNHEYSVPEIIALPICAGNEPYMQWVRSVTTG